jgi:hypothetical protein
MGEDVMLKVDAIHMKRELIYVFVAYFTRSDCTRKTSNRVMNNQLERTWNEAVVSYFEVLSQYLTGKPEENHESPQ